MIKFVSSLCLLLCLSNSARAWNAEGHMVVSQIAYNHLNPVAKARCDALIATTIQYASALNNTFVTAACWADDIKGSTTAYNSWHYIDIPFSLDHTSTNIAPAAFDVVRAINQCVANLQSQAVNQSNQAVSLRFLLHFVGDIQQPLHCSTAVSAAHPTGDAGGNSFTLDSTWFNLHSLWDGGGGFLFDSVSRPLSQTGQNNINAKVALIEADYPYNYTTNLGTIPNPLTWAQEGWGLAQSICYVGITSFTTPDNAYLTTATATTEQRMAQGGHRLADLLNTLFQPIVLNPISSTNGNFRFSWSAVSNSTYKVQWKGRLSDSGWNDLMNITSTNTSVLFQEKFSPTQRFYRVSQ